ncbi:MAG: hypothetical protein ACTHK0_00810 [Ginsengibacter sp.]
MKKFIFLSVVFLLSIGFAYPQGCIMVHNISGFGQYNLTDNAFSSSSWQLNINNRYFKSFRDFKGTADQKTPRQDESVVNSFTTDISVDRLFNKGWSIDLSTPFGANSRTASLEHGGAGTPRHTTHTFGLGDIRFTVYKWLLTPSVSQKGNIQLGLGVKFPTGDYKYQDYFYRNDSTKVLAPVNASIALGDGGTGVTTELNAFYFFNQLLSLYGNFYYLINPRDVNGVSTTFGNAPTSLQIKTGADVYSVPDVYSLRAGFVYNFNKLALSAGLRDEGVPVRDLFGGNDGLRRPGHNLSVEPGIIYKMKKASVYAYVPFIVSRLIKQNLTDAQATEITGIYRMGSGGSGNYQVFAGVLFKM